MDIEGELLKIIDDTPVEPSITKSGVVDNPQVPVPEPARVVTLQSLLARTHDYEMTAYLCNMAAQEVGLELLGIMHDLLDRIERLEYRAFFKELDEFTFDSEYVDDGLRLRSVDDLISFALREADDEGSS
jgi:hypothetical protein